jgi:hypothetical protein
MRLMFRSLATAAAVVALAGPAFAGQAKPAKSAAAKPAKPTVITTSGTVTKFDAASNALTVTTAKGDVTFAVDSSASVMVNGKKVAASELSTHTGQKATVHYTESGGQKMAQSVAVSAAAPKTASASSTPTKKAPAKKS